MFFKKDCEADSLSFAEWLNNWSESPVFCLTPHTSDALIRTLYAQVLLVKELLNNGYEYVILRKLQSDPIAGYIAKKLIKRLSCIICKSCLVSEKGYSF